MKLKIADPKTIDDLKRNIENLAEQVIGKDITKDTETLSSSLSEVTGTSDCAGDPTATDIIITNLQTQNGLQKTAIESLITQINLLISNIEGQ